MWFWPRRVWLMCSPQLGGIGVGASASSSAPVIPAGQLKADWEQFIDNMGKSICEEQSPQR